MSRLISLFFLLQISCGKEEKATFKFSLQPMDIPAPVIEKLTNVFQEFNANVGSQLIYLCTKDCTGTIEFGELDDPLIVGLCTPIHNNFTRSSFNLKKGFITQRHREIHADFKFSNKLLSSLDDELFRVTVLHELGHAVGFGHSKSTEDIMHPFVNGKKNYTGFFSSVSNRVRSFTQ